jgi:hypothetical protein
MQIASKLHNAFGGKETMPTISWIFEGKRLAFYTLMKQV